MADKFFLFDLTNKEGEDGEGAKDGEGEDGEAKEDGEGEDAEEEEAEAEEEEDSEFLRIQENILMKRPEKRSVMGWLVWDYENSDYSF